MKDDSTETDHLLLIDDPHPEAQEMLKHLRKINEPILAYFKRIDSIVKNFNEESPADLWALVRLAREQKKELVEKRDSIKKMVDSPGKVASLNRHREAIDDWEARISAFKRILERKALRHTSEASSKKSLSKRSKHLQHKQWVINEYYTVKEKYPEDSDSKNRFRVTENYQTMYGAKLREQYPGLVEKFYDISESSIRLYCGHK